MVSKLMSKLATKILATNILDSNLASHYKKNQFQLSTKGGDYKKEGTSKGEVMEEGQAHLTMEAKTQDQTVMSVQTQGESIQDVKREGYTWSVQEEAQTVQALLQGQWLSIFTPTWTQPRMEERRPCICFMEAHQGWLSIQGSDRKHKLVLYVMYPRFCAHSRTFAHMTGHVVHVSSLLHFILRTFHV